MTQDLNSDGLSVAAWIARFLEARGIDRIFGLQGGHIQPIWDFAAQRGIRIVDVRHECAAVHMAHAHAELTGGLGVAMVTAGPGVTNTVTAIANASLARMPVLVIGGCTSRPQANMGPLQDIPHVDIIKPVARLSRTARVAEQVIRELDEAVARAMGDGGEPGPVYVEIPTDVLRQHVPEHLVLDDWMTPKAPRVLPPDPGAVAEAAQALWSAKRPVIVAGRGANGAKDALNRLLDASGALYLDTQEARGLVSGDHPSFVGAMRGQVMQEADLVITVGRRLDYQLGYGSPAVFPHARFVRISDTASELIDNRRGTPELLATPALALDAIAEAGAALGAPALDRTWADGTRAKHVSRAQGGNRETPQTGKDGKIHPMAIFDALKAVAEPDYIAVADGGDFLSFARVGLEARTYLDAGAFGCLGVGVPYANAASLAFPDRQVICVTGDGAYGLNAMEIDTAVRQGAKPVIIVSNNAAWNIERFDQSDNYGGRVVGTLLRHSDYAGMATALGLHGERVEDPADLKDAIARALANAPAVVDVITSQDAVSSDAKKGLGFVPDYQPLTVWDDAERKRRGLA
ncbi:thiamine pyrophosphate-binding protein [Maliponia aquimaris]|uniref:Acetolactate synthase large subunit IlvG n=1 Tax=Maliponia aquimaris TaxID=1673631 RepID=A0A238JR03_9RHOB|nr:thiamine pyrophosphate-binding protein [Maliponia aquimaris]SMX33081.1 Acetolactate synthase large subunit IlvG [Maliponia aquimaris]